MACEDDAAFHAKQATPNEQLGQLAHVALRFAAWTERWVPDAFIFALIATVAVFLAGFAFCAVDRRRQFNR
ncbi:MAG: hypothetical protein M3Y69_03070 [Verrucomicrobiota bacterium]|nr:hypothetical protein [Verrucomicrobiota bacterium]